MCNSCEVMNINGCNGHEIGCPESWKDYKAECEWCGTEFIPAEKGQKCCCDDCAEVYYN